MTDKTDKQNTTLPNELDNKSTILENEDSNDDKVINSTNSDNDKSKSIIDSKEDDNISNEQKITTHSTNESNSDTNECKKEEINDMEIDNTINDIKEDNEIKKEDSIKNDTNEDKQTIIHSNNESEISKEEEINDNENSNSSNDSNEIDLFEALKAMSEKFNVNLNISSGNDLDYLLPPEKLNLEGIANGIKDGKFKNIIIMAGAGISVAAGIPDFRTPGTGLYSQLEKYNLDDPADIFTLDFFRMNPKPFNILAKTMFPGNFKPTLAHYFCSLLHKKGLLLRDYTQNIDTLERVAGVPGDKLVEAHGAFSDAHCIDCSKEYSTEFVKEIIMKDEIPTCSECQGYIKPDIVFFGESLPARFFTCKREDFKKCDLLIVMGTSLTVHPFASLVDCVNDNCVRLLINREEVGVSDSLIRRLLGGSGGFEFNSTSNKRDAKWLGEIEEGIKEFTKLLGWEDELKELAK